MINESLSFHELWIHSAIKNDATLFQADLVNSFVDCHLGIYELHSPLLSEELRTLNFLVRNIRRFLELRSFLAESAIGLENLQSCLFLLICLFWEHLFLKV